MLHRFDIPKLIDAIVLVAILVMAVRVPVSPDIWWHLQCGRVQWQTRAVLKSDIFSHTAAGTPWVNQSWLPQLTMAGLYELGGLGALSLGTAALLTVAFAFVLFGVRTQGRYGHFWRAFVVLWAAISTGRVWVPRPHVITFVLTAVWVYVLDRHRRQNNQQIGVLWWMVPLMVLWANSHGGYIVGFILLAIQIAGILGATIWRRRFENLWPEVRPLLIIAGLSLLAAMLNPQGLRLILFPVQTLGSSAQQNLIAEWASPDFHAADMLPFLGLLLATWSALVLADRSPLDRDAARHQAGSFSHQVAWIDWLRLLAFTTISLRSGRYIGLCAITIAPLLIRYGQPVWARLSVHWIKWPSSIPPARGIPALNWALLMLIVLAAGVKVYVALDPQTIDRVQQNLFPADAVAFVRAHDLPANLFNDYGWGGYLIWELYPDVPVFIDGRADPFGDDLIVAYRHAITAQQGWDAVLERYHVRTVLIRSQGALASVLRESVLWHVVYEDEIASVFVRDQDRTKAN